MVPAKSSMKAFSRIVNNIRFERNIRGNGFFAVFDKNTYGMRMLKKDMFFSRYDFASGKHVYVYIPTFENVWCFYSSLKDGWTQITRISINALAEDVDARNEEVNDYLRPFEEAKEIGNVTDDGSAGKRKGARL